MAVPHRRCSNHRLRDYIWLLPPEIPTQKHRLERKGESLAPGNYENDQKQQDDSTEITAKQDFIMTVSDSKTWLMCGTLYATYTAAAVHNFFPTVVAGLGISTNKSYGLAAVSFERPSF